MALQKTLTAGQTGSCIAITDAYIKFVDVHITPLGCIEIMVKAYKDKASSKNMAVDGIDLGLVRTDYDKATLKNGIAYAYDEIKKVSKLDGALDV